MRLLFDQNLSHRLVHRLADVYPGSVHVRDVGLKEAPDPLVWAYAQEHGLMIVSKDADFHQRSFLFGAPPKIVWLRLGNCTTDDVERLLRARSVDVAFFFADEISAFLALS